MQGRWGLLRYAALKGGDACKRCCLDGAAQGAWQVGDCMSLLLAGLSWRGYVSVQSMQCRGCQRCRASVQSRCFREDQCCLLAGRRLLLTRWATRGGW